MGPEYDLRRGTAADEDFARRLHRAAYRDVVTRQFGRWDEAEQDGFFEAKWEPARYHVVLLRNEPVGVLRVTRRDGEELFIDEIQLLPAAQGMGLGSALLQDVMEEARSAGLPVRLRVLRENRAKALYERLGFVVYDESETHFLMEWLARAR